MRVLQGVKRLLRAQFPSTYAHLATAYNEHIKRYGVVSYAQEGEDLIVREIFAAQNGGGGGNAPKIKAPRKNITKKIAREILG